MTPYSVRLVIRRTTAAADPKSDSQVDAKSDTETAAKFEARWVELDGQSSKPFPLKPSLLPKDAAELRWYLEKFHQFVGAGTLARAAKIEAKLDGWGKALFDAAFGTVEGTNVYRNMLEAEKQDRSVLLTLGTTEAEVLVQPWELMRDERGPLAFRGVSIRRQLEGSKPMQMLEMQLPIRLLLIVSRPTNSGFIDPRTSVRPLLDGLDHLPKGAVEVEFCEPPTLVEVSERISQARKQKQPFHIVHFDGHGAYLQQTGVGALCFEKKNRKTEYVTGQAFGDLLSRLEVPLVMLEACQTSDLSDQPVFDSVAPALLKSGVGSVVAFSHSIHIEASKILVKRFYRELAEGMSVGQALAESRVRMRAEAERWLALGPNPPTVKLQDWFVPQLYQVGPDLSLIGEDVDLGQGAGPGVGSVLVESWESKMHDFPPEPNYSFQGRALELLELGRAFEKHNAVVVAGMGGMGKTALSREAAAWWLRTGRFDEAAFCSFEQVRSVDRAVQIFGQALEGLEFSQRPAEEQQAAAVSLFRGRRVLLVWDNFESMLPQYQEGDSGSVLGFEEEERGRLRAFYRQLTDGKPAGRLLVTCRPDDTGLPRIKKVPLEGLKRHDSLYLVTAIADIESIDLERDEYEPAEIERVLDDLNDHPLSISLVVPQLEGLTPEEVRMDFGRHLDSFADDDAEEGRNRSLRASLAFSVSRLSDAARDVLPWLAWFRGGAMEASILSFTEMEPEAWASVRRELESTALVRVEELVMFKTPFVRFHPTLPFAARADEVSDVDAAEQRFIEVYFGVSGEVGSALAGQTAAAGMELMTREEANARAAVDLAFRRGEWQKGVMIADALQMFLEMAGRRRERDALAAAVRSQIPENIGLDEATCASIQSHAQGLFAAGRQQEAVEALEGLVGRLESEGLAGGEDPAFQIGTTCATLGQIFVAHRSELAIEASQRAVDHLENASGTEARGNLSGALGILAIALRKVGRHAEALEVAERSVTISEDLGALRNAAAGHGSCAQILTEQGRYAEAEARYKKVFDLARRVNDQELQGIALQQQGVLYDAQGKFDSAAILYEQAVGLFQRTGNQEGEMRTYNALANVERKRGHLDAAEAWYSRSRELAEAADDRAQLAAISQNIGVLLQTRAEQTKDLTERAALLRRAIASIDESLAIQLERQDQVGAAASYFQLGVLYRMLGNLNEAEEQLLKALKIRESLDLPDVWKDYGNLAKVAEARGDAKAASEWTAKRDAKLEEVRRLAGGNDGPATLPEKMAQAFLGLAQAVHATRASDAEIPAELAEVLAQLVAQPEPLASAGLFLRAVAEGKSPTVPAGLPEPLPKIFGELLASLDG